jgi:hypothetical protein
LPLSPFEQEQASSFLPADRSATSLPEGVFLVSEPSRKIPSGKNACYCAHVGPQSPSSFPQKWESGDESPHSKAALTLSAVTATLSAG